jgi:guanylate kinase
MYDKIIITGKSASGKNFLFSKLSEKFKPLVKHTTRPKRSTEQEGIDYHFIGSDEFKSQLDSGIYLTHQSFYIGNETTWYYGIHKESFKESQLAILTPGEIQELKDKDLLNDSIIIFLDIDRSVLESRIIARNDSNDSMKRRLDSDDKDFEGFINYDHRIVDENFTTNSIYDILN